LSDYYRIKLAEYGYDYINIRKEAEEIKSKKKNGNSKITKPLPAFPATTEYQNNDLDFKNTSNKK